MQDFKNIVASLAQKGRAIVRSRVQPDMYSLLRLRREVTGTSSVCLCAFPMAKINCSACSSA